jgi:hypothetical protein
MAKNLFNSVKMTKPQNNVFDLTHDVKLSTNMGDLTPILTMECVPGDKFDLSCESMIRFAPMIAPVMHRMDVTMHYFFVPNRILWSNWESFITNANSGIVPPYFNSDDTRTAAQKRLMDYMGVPPCPAGGTLQKINALPFAAYQCIYNEYYRDQNLVAPIDYKLADGGLSGAAKYNAILTPRVRAWEHDYFTASLPFAQKGPAVDIPLGEVELNSSTNPGLFKQASSHSSALSGAVASFPPGKLQVSSTDAVYDPNGTLEVQPTTINELRRAFRLQEWLEKNARGGTRYIENILAHFGVKSSDSRLQRPEYITGVKSPVIISEIVQTSQSNLTAQGNLAGHGISVGSGRNGSYYCEEHGYIIGIMSVMPKTAYQQGIPKTFLKDDPLEYFWPSFAHIGEQEVTLNELYAYTPQANDTFGYVPRYAEYKYMPSRVAGDFRTSLDYWHLGRIFGSAPALNQTFIECTPANTERIFAVVDPETETQKLYCHILNKIKAVRPMPKYGTPQF